MIQAVQTGQAVRERQLANGAETAYTVVVRATNWLGDNLMSMPALYQLRHALGSEVRMVILCKSALRPLWQMADWVDSVIDFPGRRVGKEEIRALRELQADAALILPNSFGSAFDLSRCGIPFRIGRKGRGRGCFLTRRLPVRSAAGRGHEGHQAEEYYELAETLAPVSRELPEQGLLTVHSKVREEAQERFRLFADAAPVLAIAPGAAYGPAKQWPLEFFRETALASVEKGYSIILLGTEQERAVADWIAQGTNPIRNLCGRTSLSELAALLRMSEVCLANDSGIMHLAAALGTAGVAIFGSTSAVATGPLAGNWEALDNEEECSPCFRRECTRGDSPYACLYSITPSSVCQAIEKVVKLRAGRRNL